MASPLCHALLSLPDGASFLYASPWSCASVFHALSPIAKQIVLRLVPAGKMPIAEQSLSAWFESSTASQNLYTMALKELKELHIFVPEGDSVYLHEQFCQSLQQSLMGELQISPAVIDAGKTIMSLDELTQISMDRWEAILYHLVSIPGLPTPAKGVRQLVKLAGLKKKGKKDGEEKEEKKKVTLSKEGWCFLFKRTSEQIWILLLAYLSGLADRQQDSHEVLSLLFSLPFREIAQPYSLGTLTPSQLSLLHDLADLGLTVVDRPQNFFYVTPLGRKVALSATALEEDSWGAFLIVETNFKVYAQTEHPYYVYLLSLFCEMKYRLPGCVAGLITRNAVGKALRTGLDANHIIDFMTGHCHPATLNRETFSEAAEEVRTGLPENIRDQILLWEAERDRLQFNNGVLLTDFESEAVRRKARQLAEAAGGLLLDVPKLQGILVKEEVVEACLHPTME